jgi:hypothetical protein
MLREIENKARGLRLIVTATCHAPLVDMLVNPPQLDIGGFDASVEARDANDTAVEEEDMLLRSWNKMWTPPNNPAEGGFKMTKFDLLEMASALDMIACLIFLMLAFFMHDQEQTEADWFNLESVECADYTVLIEQLPPHKNSKLLMEDMRKHFDEVLNLKHVHSNAMKKRGAEADRPVSVNAIHFGYDNHIVMNAELRRFQLMENIEMAGHKLDCIQVQFDPLLRALARVLAHTASCLCAPFSHTTLLVITRHSRHTTAASSRRRRSRR